MGHGKADEVDGAAIGGGDSYETITYEGYGPGGVAVIVETMTDSRNRTAADVRHYFDKFGGNLGTTGCVSFMFSSKGVIYIPAEGLDEDKAMEDALECGAEDFVPEEEMFEVYTDPADLRSVADALTEKGYKYESAEVEKIPANYVRLDDEDQIKMMNRLLEALEDNDDVQNVWHNWEDAE